MEPRAVGSPDGVVGWGRRVRKAGVRGLPYIGDSDGVATNHLPKRPSPLVSPGLLSPE